MEVDYTLLGTIHRILIRRTDLRSRRDRGPRQITLAQTAETKFEEELQSAKEIRTKAMMLADEKQLQLSEREAKIKDLRSKLNVAETNKEYQLLNDHIAADEQANSVLSDEILELLVKIDTLSDELKLAEENLAKAKKETSKVKERISTETSTLDAELAVIAVELEECERQLNGDHAAEYRRLVAHREEDALAETDLETCGQCNTKITAQRLTELMLKRPVFCQSCGSLMYVGESQATPSGE